MKMLNKLLIIVSCIALASCAMPNRTNDEDTSGGVAAANSDAPSARYGLVSAEQTLLPPPAFINANTPRGGIRLDVPIPLNVDYTPSNSGQWESLDDTRQLWRLRLYSIAGVDMQIRFDPLTLPIGSELWFVPHDGAAPIGPVTQAQIQDNQYSSRRVNNHDVTIELLMPLKSDASAFNDPSLAELVVKVVKVY